MKVHNVHERTLAAPRSKVEALFTDMDPLWPTPVFPAPKQEGDKLRMGAMLWQPIDREGAAVAFDVVAPPEFRASHWFEVDEGASRGTTIRHTIEGEVVGDFEPVWRDRIEPLHNAYIEAMFDRVQEALA